MQNSIEVINLSKSYGSKEAVKNINFVVKKFLMLVECVYFAMKKK